MNTNSHNEPCLFQHIPNNTSVCYSYNEYKVKSESEFKQKYIKSQIYYSRALHYYSTRIY